MANAPLNREEILAGHFLLRHLRPEELSRVAASASLIRHRPQATIFQKGDSGGSMMAVVRGRVSSINAAMVAPTRWPDAAGVSSPSST